MGLTDELPAAHAGATGTLAALIERLAVGADALDEGFARELAQRLHAAGDRIALPEVDALGLDDVIVTFYMDRRMRLVVTGNLSSSAGAVQVTWEEQDFTQVPVTLSPTPRTAPYTFATLDFSVRGRRGTLRSSAGQLPAGLEVTVRALATVGEVEEYRVRAHGLEASVPRHELELLG